jgi:cytochrome c oxidase cbb3-type subunit III
MTRRVSAAAMLCALIAACDIGGTRDEGLPEREGVRGVTFPPEPPLRPGPQPGHRLITAGNPYAGDEQAVRDGYRYYLWYNCAGCHGTLGGGGIGPPLRDDDWIYGGDPASIYQSIYQGRPDGMPAYGAIASEVMIWKMTAYIQALGTPMQPTTPSFPATPSEDPIQARGTALPGIGGRAVRDATTGGGGGG